MKHLIKIDASKYNVWEDGNTDFLRETKCTIHYGPQLMPSMVFFCKIGDIGAFVYKMKLFVVM